MARLFKKRKDSTTQDNKSKKQKDSVIKGKEKNTVIEDQLPNLKVANDILIHNE